MRATIQDRIKAHHSAPDVYDPPTFDQMADRIEELEAKLEVASSGLDWIANHMSMSMAFSQGHLCSMMKAHAAKTVAKLKGDEE